MLDALGEARGDLSRLRSASAHVVLDSRTGTIRLDRNRQTIARAYLSPVERSANGKPLVQAVRIAPAVEKTFNGYITSSTPGPRRAVGS